MKTLQEIADRQQLQANVEELPKEFTRYTSATAAAVNALHQTIVGNHVKMHNASRAWASDLERRIREAIDGK
eukprot:11176386-Lingulodinium_polyedra.AAC.1